MHTRSRTALALTILGLLLLAEPGRADRYELEPGASRVAFEARHLHFGRPVRGRFSDVAGSIEVSSGGDGAWPATPVATQVEVRIASGSLDTGLSLRDEHLRTRFFDTDRHPLIRFESSGPVSPTATTLVGWLTIKGIRRRVALELSELAPVVAGDGREGIACLATTELDRREFAVVERLSQESGVLQAMGRGVDALIEDRVQVRIRVVAWPSASPDVPVER